jgi:DNA-binding MarR family transcriptional regulator
MMNASTRDGAEGHFQAQKVEGEQGPYPTSLSLSALARLLAEHIRRRVRYLPSIVVEDPQWLMTLELFVAGEEGRTVSVSSLCLASGVPSTTALRHIRTLERKGMFNRLPHPRDRRISHVRLSENARTQVARYLLSLSTGEAYEESPLRLRAAH